MSTAAKQKKKINKKTASRAAFVTLRAGTENVISLPVSEKYVDPEGQITAQKRYKNSVCGVSPVMLKKKKKKS